jgi:hypothetical protein
MRAIEFVLWLSFGIAGLKKYATGQQKSTWAKAERKAMALN